MRNGAGIGEASLTGNRHPRPSRNLSRDEDRDRDWKVFFNPTMLRYHPYFSPNEGCKNEEKEKEKEKENYINGFSIFR